MIIGLGVNIPIVNKVVDFVTKPLTQRRRQVVYQATVQAIESHASNEIKLIIPSSLSACDYSFEKLIEHIRIDRNPVISRIPIIVFFEDIKKCEELSGNFEEEWLNKVAVYLSLGEAAAEDFILDIDKKALEDYRGKAIKKLSYSKGRHDMSNKWGAYIVLKTLYEHDHGHNEFKKRLSKIRIELMEEQYFKHLIQEIDKTSNLNHRQKDLISLQDELNRLLPLKVLIIEDQLKEGWESVYKSVFPKKAELFFAENPKEARIKIKNESDIDLIVLDVRLTDEDRNKYSQNEITQENTSLSGVKLTKEIREILPTVPIIAATASNKSWTLEALLDSGINSYWVKGSPDQINSFDLGIENVIDLYTKINATLEWSQRTGHWQKELYRIAKVVESAEVVNRKEPLIGQTIYSKAKSLQALLFRSFSPFTYELSKGLQMNLAFLNIYSCMNDLTLWVCEIIRKENGEEEWHLHGEKGQPKVAEKKISAITKKLYWEFQNSDREYVKFPDADVFKVILIRKGLNFKEFEKLRKIRNGLPIIHGNIGNSFEANYKIKKIVTDENIKDLLILLGSVVDHHMKNL